MQYDTAGFSPTLNLLTNFRDSQSLELCTDKTKATLNHKLKTTSKH